MACFKAPCVGGPYDGGDLELSRAPQDGELFAFSAQHVYRFEQSVLRWIYQPPVQNQKDPPPLREVPW